MTVRQLGAVVLLAALAGRRGGIRERWWHQRRELVEVEVAAAVETMAAVVALAFLVAVVAMAPQIA